MNSFSLIDDLIALARIAAYAASRSPNHAHGQNGVKSSPARLVTRTQKYLR